MKIIALKRIICYLQKENAFEKAFEMIFDFMIKHDFYEPLYI